MTFRMGDGQSVSCAGAGRKWTRAVKPGAKSPTCGYSYTKPSLPEGSYTVAAITNWAVTWTVNNESGVINVPAVDTAELPSVNCRCSFDKTRPTTWQRCHFIVPSGVRVKTPATKGRLP